MDPLKPKMTGQDLIALFKKFGDENSEHPYNFKSDLSSGPKIPLAEELKSRFDVLVDMNAHHTAEKGKSMATFALCGCIGGYIDNHDSNTFFHYDPLSVRMIDFLSNQHVSEQTTKVHFFIPGERQKSPDGKYERQPKEEYVGRMLGSTIAFIKSKGVECVFHCYNENRISGDDYMARHQGTAWVDKQGKVFAEGRPISIPQEKPVPASSPTPPTNG